MKELKKTFLILSFSLLLLTLQLHFELKPAPSLDSRRFEPAALRPQSPVAPQPSQVIEAVLAKTLIQLPKDWREAYEGEHRSEASGRGSNPVVTLTFFLPGERSYYIVLPEIKR
ncbi:MAG: hypothetical protein M3511_01880 [Deinococcota bacterium]|jgi:hypothetical protein|nr:hypothetical protein [Deinococcota bacterium]